MEVCLPLAQERVVVRNFGGSGICVSPCTFGSMRLDAQRISRRNALALLQFLYDHGVTTFHSSHEYDGHVFFCDVMKDFQRLHPARQVQHIVKIGVPHFDETEFTPARLEEIVNGQLAALSTDRLDVVQWLLRHTPNDDRYRLPLLERSRESLLTAWNRLHGAGKVGVLASFPYTMDFAARVLEHDVCQGLVTYLNLAELEAVDLLEGIGSNGQGFVAIRPLFAGVLRNGLLSEHSEREVGLVKGLVQLGVADSGIVRFALAYPLLHPNVASVILSVSSIEHARQAIEATTGVAADPERFRSITQAFATAGG